MQTPHPWRELRLLKRLALHWQELRPGMWGATDGERIWMDPRQLQVESRCTLAHESRALGALTARTVSLVARFGPAITRNRDH
jgi:hypothetical protein